MLPAVITFSSSAVIFVVVAVFVQIENARQKRLFLASGRKWLDIKLVELRVKISGHWNHFTQYIVKLGWYYGIHSLLRTVLRLLVSVYTHVERLFEHNRTRTKQLRMKRKQLINVSHLTKMADHKIETALTKKQQIELRKKKLEQDH